MAAPVLIRGRAEPFPSAAEAWLWTAQALAARRDGARIRAGAGKVPRPCEPDDLCRELFRLYRQRRITTDHAMVLRRYGDRGVPPDPRASPAEARDLMTWRDVMAALEPILLAKGIVAHPPPRGGTA